MLVRPVSENWQLSVIKLFSQILMELFVTSTEEFIHVNVIFEPTGKELLLDGLINVGGYGETEK